MTEPLTPSEREIQRVYSETLRLPREDFQREADRVRLHGGTLGALTHDQSLAVIAAGENLWAALSARPRSRRGRLLPTIGITLGISLALAVAAFLAAHGTL